MSYITPTQSDIQKVLKSFLSSILPCEVEIVQGQLNRVPEPKSPEFVLATVISRTRLSTNIDSWVDCSFIASISENIDHTIASMTVTEMLIGSIGIHHSLLGVGVASGSTVEAQQSGTPGGIGVYTINPLQTLVSTKLATGVGHYIQPTRVVIQLDVHSADLKRASDMAQTISTMMRDWYATNFFDNCGYDITPLYADDPRQVAFINESLQYEARYIVEAHLQANQTVELSQEFFDQAQIGLKSVDVLFPE